MRCLPCALTITLTQTLTLTLTLTLALALTLTHLEQCDAHPVQDLHTLEEEDVPDWLIGGRVLGLGLGLGARVGLGLGL